MNSSKVKIMFVVSSILLITVVLSFTGGLNIASFKQNYTNSLVSSYAVTSGETVRKIEYAVKYGKPLTNFYGIEDLLQRSITHSNDLEKIQVVLTDGSVIYDQTGPVLQTKLESKMQAEANFEGKDRDYTYVLNDGKYHVFLPIYDKNNKWIGSLGLIFDESVVKSRVDTHMWSLIRYLVILALLALLFLILFISRVSIISESGTIRKKQMIIVLLIILGSVQILFGIINYLMFKSAYIVVAKENAEITSQTIERDIVAVTQKGVPYEKFYKLEDYLQRITESIPEMKQIYITNSKNKVLYTTSGSQTGSNLNLNPDYLKTRSLGKDSTGNQIQINVEISKTYLDSRMRDIILDTVTVLVTSFLFMVEITLFMLIILRRQLLKSNTAASSRATAASKEAEEGSKPRWNLDLAAPPIEVKDEIHQLEQEQETDYSAVRPLAFILFIGVFMSTSFIPVVMKNLYEPLWGLSKSVIIALPLSVEMLAAAFATIFPGYIIDNKGWRPAFFAGLLFIAVGTLFSAFSWDAITFIITRGIVGIGYGFSLMALRSYVNSIPTEEGKTEGVSALFSGLYAGVNCGVVVGAMLADRIGFSQVFIIGMVIVILSGLFALFFVKNLPVVHKKRAISQQLVRKSKGKYLRFFSNGKVMGFFLLVLIPTVVCGMFLDYYFPLFADANGFSTSNVGRAFLLNGLCIVYLGPLLSKYTTKYLGIEKAVFLSGLIIVAGLLLFASQGTLITAFIAVLLLGVSDSFGLVAQNNYFIKLRATDMIGTGKALGYFDNVRKIGQMLGPLVFGSVAVMGFSGIGLIGYVLLGSLILFLILTAVYKSQTKLRNTPDGTS